MMQLSHSPFASRFMTCLAVVGGLTATACDGDTADEDASTVDAGASETGGTPSSGGTPGGGGEPGGGGTPGGGGGTPGGGGEPGGGGTPGDTFEASDADFADYMGWHLVDYTSGPVNAALGTAHMGPDPAFSRMIWSSVDPAEAAGGEWPTGTRLVKETFTWAGGEKQLAPMGGVLAMAKRGGGFNPGGGDWEWFELRPDATIAMRGGAEMMMGMCNGCHAAATGDVGNDRVFRKPSDVQIDADDFDDYASWTPVDDIAGPGALLGPAHAGQDENTHRVVYRKQALGRPDPDAHGYPIGTALAKAVFRDDAVIEVTVMVKRGWGFAPEQSDWEWFMLDPATGAIADRGPDLMDGMCTNCHSQANDPANGIDYVFKHAGDAFNK